MVVNLQSFGEATIVVNNIDVSAKAHCRCLGTVRMILSAVCIRLAEH
jgi:hypothetical protein